MSTMSKFNEAAKQAREDGRAKLEASRPYGTRGSGSGQVEDWGKARGKKGNSFGFARD